MSPPQAVTGLASTTDSGFEREMNKMMTRLTAMETRLTIARERHEREIAVVKREMIQHRSVAETIMAEQRSELFAVKENMQRLKVCQYVSN